jgi:hypothetical protein
MQFIHTRTNYIGSPTAESPTKQVLLFGKGNKGNKLSLASGGYNQPNLFQPVKLPSFSNGNQAIQYLRKLGLQCQMGIYFTWTLPAPDTITNNGSTTTLQWNLIPYGFTKLIGMALSGSLNQETVNTTVRNAFINNNVATMVVNGNPLFITSGNQGKDMLLNGLNGIEAPDPDKSAPICIMAYWFYEQALIAAQPVSGYPTALLSIIPDNSASVSPNSTPFTLQTANKITVNADGSVFLDFQYTDISTLNNFGFLPTTPLGNSAVSQVLTDLNSTILTSGDIKASEIIQYIIDNKNNPTVISFSITKINGDTITPSRTFVNGDPTMDWVVSYSQDMLIMSGYTKATVQWNSEDGENGNLVLCLNTDEAKLNVSPDQPFNDLLKLNTGSITQIEKVEYATTTVTGIYNGFNVFQTSSTSGTVRVSVTNVTGGAFDVTKTFTITLDSTQNAGQYLNGLNLYACVLQYPINVITDITTKYGDFFGIVKQLNLGNQGLLKHYGTYGIAGNITSLPNQSANLPSPNDYNLILPTYPYVCQFGDVPLDNAEQNVGSGAVASAVAYMYANGDIPFPLLTTAKMMLPVSSVASTTSYDRQEGGNGDIAIEQGWLVLGANITLNLVEFLSSNTSGTTLPNTTTTNTEFNQTNVQDSIRYIKQEACDYFNVIKELPNNRGIAFNSPDFREQFRAGIIQILVDAEANGMLENVNLYQNKVIVIADSKNAKDILASIPLQIIPGLQGVDITFNIFSSLITSF